MQDLTSYHEHTGQSLWLDNLSRGMLLEGRLKQAVDRLGIRGVTSNPSILDKALRETPAYYRADLRNLHRQHGDAETVYEQLIARDVQMACDLLTPLWEKTEGVDGYVSWEVSPALAHDAPGTVAAAAKLRALAGRDNLMIKVPATPAGVSAFEELIARGFNVNVTLIFGLPQLEAVFRAYLAGLQRWAAGGGDPQAVRSVASIFLSRIDSVVDARLDANGTPEALALRGRAALALAARSQALYVKTFHGPEFVEMRAVGAHPQTPLWASTGTKNPAYSDLLYVEPVMWPETVNTLPDATLVALADHGQIERRPAADLAAEQAHVAALAGLGIDLDGAVAEQLQKDGLRQFQDSHDRLLALVAETATPPGD
ncbi:MAG TPA: transaldolase [Chromatiales bacterium]|nr:transaldolase [Chromatiales bacterium]